MERTDQIARSTPASETQKTVANFIERGRVLTGLGRVSGKGIQGKSISVQGLNCHDLHSGNNRCTDFTCLGSDADFTFLVL